MSEDEKVANEYFQGRACCERYGYRSDNPHEYGSERWEAWLIGFDEADVVFTLNAKSRRRRRRCREMQYQGSTMRRAFEAAEIAV